MLVRKSKISQLIKKERQKERSICQKENDLIIINQKKELTEEHASILRETKKKFRQQLNEKERENLRLKKEIDKNYSLYQDIRQKEKHIDGLSDEIEDVVDAMVVRVQESLQPFYRTRSKIESSKRRSDRKNEKVESIFRAIK